VLEHFVERTGLDFQRELEKSVWKAATALGFKSSTSDEDRAGAVELELKKESFRLQASFMRFFDRPWFRMRLVHPLKNGFRQLELGSGELEPAKFRAALTEATKTLTTEGPRLMEDPENYKPPRSRR
ncbi:MAG: hypothetical protein JNM17_01610, partial [Archangium sp.]|nr:hypothetical protein [Archangium sp.]